MGHDTTTVAESLVHALDKGADLSGALCGLIEAVGIPEAKQVIVAMYLKHSKRWAEALYALWKAKDVDRYGATILG